MADTIEKNNIGLTPHTKIFIAGHKGLVGSAIVRRLKAEGCSSLLLRTRDELDLLNQSAVQSFFEQERPEIVVLAAAKVGGILAYSLYPGEFIYENPLEPENRGETAFVPRQFLHLSQACTTAHERGVSVDRIPGTDQRCICSCKDCRD